MATRGTHTLPFPHLLAALLLWAAGAWGIRCQAQSTATPNQSSAQRVLDSLTAALSEMPEDTGKVKALINIAQKYNRTDFKVAQEYAMKAMELSESLEWKDGVARAHTEMGMSYYHQEEYEPALDHHLAALDIYQELGDKPQVAHCYNNIANVHSSIGNLELAIEHFERSKKLFYEVGMPEEAIYPAHNMASVYSDLNQHQRALDVYYENLSIIREKNLTNKRLKAATLNNIGNTLREIGKCEEALPYLRESEAIKLELNDRVGLGNSWNNIGCCLIRTGKLTEGETLVRKALQLAKETNRLAIQVESYKFLSELAEARSDYKTALQMAQIMTQLSDSLEARTQQDRVAGMQRSYEQSKLEKAETEKAKMVADAELLQKENSFRTRLTLALIVVMGLLVVLVVVLLLAFTSRNRNNKALRDKGEQIEEQSNALRLTNEELRLKNERLEDLMREKDGLIGIVAHDLKAPLARSAGLANLVTLSGNLTDEQRSYIKMIEKVTEQGQALIRDLLDLNSIEHQETRLSISALNLVELSSETVASFQGEASKKNITVEASSSSPSLEVRTDKAYLSRVLDNLISNAIKFSPKGSMVVVRAEQRGGMARLSIQDQGPGISAEDRKKLFKKFQRLSARPTGGESSTGLGLAITKALVEKLHGTIDVISEPGKGAEFVVILPLEWEMQH